MVREEQPGDLSSYRGMTFRQAVQEDGQAPWGLSHEHWKQTSHLGAVLSIPIPPSGPYYGMVGCLNVDTELPPEESVLTEAMIKNLLEKHIPSIAMLMDRAGARGRVD